MIVLIGSEKGGTGKTTIAVNLAAMRAIRGYDVLLLDADRQGSASMWAAIRDESEASPRIPCLAKYGENIHTELKSLSKKYDDIVVDTGGRDSHELRSAMLEAHKLLIPVQPSQFDLWGLSKMSRLISDCHVINSTLEAYAVINRAPTNPLISESEEAREYTNEFENINMVDAIIRDRIAFRRAARDGLAVMEVNPADAKARAEIENLYSEVFQND